MLLKICLKIIGYSLRLPYFPSLFWQWATRVVWRHYCLYQSHYHPLVSEKKVFNEYLLAGIIIFFCKLLDYNCLIQTPSKTFTTVHIWLGVAGKAAGGALGGHLRQELMMKADMKAMAKILREHMRNWGMVHTLSSKARRAWCTLWGAGSPMSMMLLSYLSK